MKKSYLSMLEDAAQKTRQIDVNAAHDMQNSDDIVFVDVRDIRELEREGMIKGARHAPRGMLEFWIDSQSPYHKPYFAEDRLFVFYCASGWRSLLAAQTASEMGLRVASMEGGFGEWKKQGFEVENKSGRSSG